MYCIQKSRFTIFISTVPKIFNSALYLACYTQVNFEITIIACRISFTVSVMVVKFLYKIWLKVSGKKVSGNKSNMKFHESIPGLCSCFMYTGGQTDGHIHNSFYARSLWGPWELLIKWPIPTPCEAKLFPCHWEPNLSSHILIIKISSDLMENHEFVLATLVPIVIGILQHAVLSWCSVA